MKKIKIALPIHEPDWPSLAGLATTEFVHFYKVDEALYVEYLNSLFQTKSLYQRITKKGNPYGQRNQRSSSAAPAR